MNFCNIIDQNIKEAVTVVTSLKIQEQDIDFILLSELLCQKGKD